jgi:hypothetical protein
MVRCGWGYKSVEINDIGRWTEFAEDCVTSYSLVQPWRSWSNCHVMVRQQRTYPWSTFAFSSGDLSIHLRKVAVDNALQRNVDSIKKAYSDPSVTEEIKFHRSVMWQWSKPLRSDKEKNAGKCIKLIVYKRKGPVQRKLYLTVYHLDVWVKYTDAKSCIDLQCMESNLNTKTCKTAICSASLELPRRGLKRNVPNSATIAVIDYSIFCYLIMDLVMKNPSSQSSGFDFYFGPEINCRIPSHLASKLSMRKCLSAAAQLHPSVTVLSIISVINTVFQWPSLLNYGKYILWILTFSALIFSQWSLVHVQTQRNYDGFTFRKFGMWWITLGGREQAGDRGDVQMWTFW